MAVDYFLKLDGIPGESMDGKHKDEIQVLSYAFAEKQHGTFAHGGGGGAGKVRMEDFKFTMHANKASPKLFLACATGQHIPKAVLTVRKSGGRQEDYMKIIFTNLLVSSYGTGGSGGDVLPVDAIALNFEEIEFEYKAQNVDGSLGAAIKGKYNLKESQWK